MKLDELYARLHGTIAERDVPFHRYITDYLFAHDFLKDDGTVRNIP